MNNVVSKANSAEFLPGDRHYIPVELREENYNKIRDTIFNKQVQNQYLIELWKCAEKLVGRKSIRKNIVDSVHRAVVRKDPRVFVEVDMEGIQIKGLLDSGVSFSVLERNCRELVQDMGLSIYRMWKLPVVSNTE